MEKSNRLSLFNRISDFLKKHDTIVFTMVLLFVTLFAYRNYIWGEKYLVISHEGSDSINQFYPYFLYYARRIANGEIGQIYNFSEGLGKLSGPLSINLSNWFCFFGENNVAYLMGINQVLRVVFSGVFAYIFARLRRGSYWACSVVGLGYAFCAQIMLRQDFASYGLETLIVIVWLTVYEYSFKKNKVIAIPIVTWIVFQYFDGLSVILWGLTFAAYIIFSCLVDDVKVISWKKMIFYELVFCASYVVLWGKSIYYFVINSLSSTRFNNVTASISASSSGNVGDTYGVLNASNLGIVDYFSRLIEKPYALLAYFLRTVGLSINGTGVNYHGYISNLTDGGFYCGILVMLLIPYALYKMRWRKKIVYGLAYLAMGIYVLFPKLRFFLNGYGCTGFRFSTLRIILLLILTFIDISIIIQTNTDFKLTDELIIIATWLVVNGIMIFALKTGKVQETSFWIISMVIISIYTILILLYFNRKEARTKLRLGIILFAVFEAVLVPRGYIDDRVVMTKDDLMAGYYYEDGTKEAIEYIKINDDGWYRIEKDYDSVFLCDPLAQEYYGTTAYIGGLGIGDELIRTCDILGINRRSTDLLYGALGNIYMYSLFDVKYLLSKNSEISTYGFKYLTTVGGINIYENTLALPVAYVMDNSVHLDKILKFDDINRQRALLKSCIVEDTEKEEGWSYNYLDFEELSKYKNKKPQENELSLVRMTIPDNDTVYIFENNQYNEPVRKGVLGRNGNEVYVEYLDTVESIEVYTTYIVKELEVDNLDVSISELNPEKYYSEIKKDIKRAQNNGLVISENNGYHIKGTINTDIDGMLVTSIPYEGPWKIKIDGENCETEKVNMYFLGTKINKGAHEVEIYYIPDNSYITVYSGIIITLLKVVCLGLILEFGNQLYRNRLKKVNVNN